MSRPRQTQASREAAAKDAFRQEVKLQRVYLDMTQGELAEQVDLNGSVLSKCLANPDKLSVERLRRIVQILDMNPLTILGLFYDQKTLLKFKGES